MRAADVLSKQGQNLLRKILQELSVYWGCLPHLVFLLELYFVCVWKTFGWLLRKETAGGQIGKVRRRQRKEQGQPEGCQGSEDGGEMKEVWKRAGGGRAQH